MIHWYISFLCFSIRTETYLNILSETFIFFRKKAFYTYWALSEKLKRLKGLLRKNERGYRLKVNHYSPGSPPMKVIFDFAVPRIWYKSVSKELNLFHKFSFCKTYIFATLWCKPLIFQTYIIWSNYLHSLKY